MFLNAAKGDGSNFVGADELVEARLAAMPASAHSVARDHVTT